MKIDLTTNQLCHAIEVAWNSSRPAEMVRLMRRDAVWRQGQQVHVGRNEIWNAFESLWQRRLHFSLNQWVHSFDKNQVGVKLVCEWQHAVHGSWHRATGEGTYVLDAKGQLSAMETHQQDKNISLSERSLPLPGSNIQALADNQSGDEVVLAGGRYE